MMNANGHGTDPWGPYRPAVEDHVAACADYLGRLQRSLAGEIAPDRQYFNDKAYQLQEVARGLVRRGQDIERWLNACNASVPRAEEGFSGLAACERAAGHTGPHDDDPPPTLAEQLCDEARALTDLTEQAGHRSAGSPQSSTSATPRGIRWDPSTARRSTTSRRRSTESGMTHGAWRAVCAGSS
jgi:hypothetical protein